MTETVYLLQSLSSCGNCLWQTQIVCNRNRLPVTDLDFLWQTMIVCHRHTLPVADRSRLWQTHVVGDRHITVFCREFTKLIIYALSRTISNKKNLVMDKKYFLEACRWPRHTRSSDDPGAQFLLRKDKRVQMGSLNHTVTVKAGRLLLDGYLDERLEFKLPRNAS